MNNRQKALTGAFVLVAALLIFGGDKPSTDVVESQPSHAEETVERKVSATSERAAASEKVLSLRRRAAPSASLQIPDGEVPHLFAAQNWNPPPPKVVPAPPAPPTAPPLPYAYIGKKLEAGQWEVFLSSGDDIRVVKANTLIDGAYRVSDIRPPTLTLTYLPLNQVQQINIGTID